GDELGQLAGTLNDMIEQTHATAEAYCAARTSLRRTLAETEAVVSAARAGDLSARADTAVLQGAFHDLAEGLNAALDVVVAPVEASARALEKLGARDLTARVDGDFAGDHARVQGA